MNTQSFASPPVSEMESLVIQINVKYLERLRYFITYATCATSADVVVTDLTKIFRTAIRMLEAGQATEVKLHAILGKLIHYTPPDNIKQHFTALAP